MPCYRRVFKKILYLTNVGNIILKKLYGVYVIHNLALVTKKSENCFYC